MLKLKVRVVLLYNGAPISKALLSNGQFAPGIVTILSSPIVLYLQ